ncbi:unnamed protein product [Orchesella dallaii]|uniref:Uncharacterized protein n=1 Tax=Orchesella dallaii TaxID=48710 RepID=A0ABP1QA57_9HEXA
MSEFNSYYLQSLYSKLGLNNAKRDSDRSRNNKNNGKDVCRDLNASKDIIGESNKLKSSVGPVYSMLPDLMMAIREPVTIPSTKRLNSNKKRGISHRKSSNDNFTTVHPKRLGNEKVASCDSSTSYNFCTLPSNRLDISTLKAEAGHNTVAPSKCTVSVTGNQDPIINPGKGELRKQKSFMVEESVNMRKQVDGPLLHYRNKVEKLYPHNNSLGRTSPSSSPRLTSESPKKEEKHVRNAIVVRTIKRGKMYGPEAIAAVSGFGITQSIIMDGSGSYTYLQVPSSKISTRQGRDKGSNLLLHDSLSTTTPSPIDNHLWTIDKSHARSIRKKSYKDNRRNVANTEDENQMPMPTAKKIIYQAVNIPELNRNRNNLTKLTINSNTFNPGLNIDANKTNSEMLMPRCSDSLSHYEKIPISLSVPTMPALCQTFSEQRSRHLQPTLSHNKPPHKIGDFCNQQNIGEGDGDIHTIVNNMLIGKPNKMRAPRKLLSSQKAMGRKGHRSKKKKKSMRYKKRTRTRSLKRIDIRLLGPKINGINFPFSQQLESEKCDFERRSKSIRTVALPFPMPKYLHTM